MEKIGFRKVCAQWVLHQLSPEHKSNHITAALDFLERYESDGEEMLSTIVTRDETWVHHFTPQDQKEADGLERT